jgi:hypothetical protein
VPTLTGAITLTGPTNCTPGQDIQVYLLNGSGAYTQTWGSSYGSDVPTLPAVANAYMLVTLSTPDGTTWHKSSAALISGITAPTTGQIFAQGANNVPVAANATNLTAPQYAAGGGSANAQTVTLSPAIAAYTNGLVVKWLPTAANTTTTPTLAVNGLTATTIVKSPGNVALAASDLTTTAVATAIYDGTYFELQNPQTASGGGAVLYDSYCLVAAGCIYNTNTSIPISGASPIYVKIFIPTAATFNYIGVVVGASSGTEYTAVALYNAGCTTKIAQSAALSITSGVLMLYYSLPTTNLAAGSYVLALSANASNANYYYNTNGAAAMGIYGANSYSWTDTSTATWSGTTPTFPSSCSGTRTFASQFISLLFQ